MSTVRRWIPVMIALAALLFVLAISGCADPNRAAMVWGAALQSAGGYQPKPQPFTHYMTPQGMTTCHNLGGGVAHCF